MKEIADSRYEAFSRVLSEQGFSPAEISGLISQTRTVQQAPRSVLLPQGEMASEFYFLLDGVCHAGYLTEQGKVFSKEFYWEGDWVIGYESLVTGQPSPFCLETVSACQMLALPISVLQCWRAERRSIYLSLVEGQLLNKEQKERYMLLNTPQQRYQQFCRNYPDLLARLSDYQVAAYLGITPISLSRIKKRQMLNHC